MLEVRPRSALMTARKLRRYAPSKASPSGRGGPTQAKPTEDKTQLDIVACAIPTRPWPDRPVTAVPSLRQTEARPVGIRFVVLALNNGRATRCAQSIVLVRDLVKPSRRRRSDWSRGPGTHFVFCMTSGSLANCRAGHSERDSGTRGSKAGRRGGGEKKNFLLPLKVWECR